MQTAVDAVQAEMSFADETPYEVVVLCQLFIVHREECLCGNSEVVWINTASFLLVLQGYELYAPFRAAILGSLPTD